MDATANTLAVLKLTITQITQRFESVGFLRGKIGRHGNAAGSLPTAGGRMRARLALRAGLG